MDTPVISEAYVWLSLHKHGSQYVNNMMSHPLSSQLQEVSGPALKKLSIDLPGRFDESLTTGSFRTWFWALISCRFRQDFNYGPWRAQDDHVHTGWNRRNHLTSGTICCATPPTLWICYIHLLLEAYQNMFSQRYLFTTLNSPLNFSWIVVEHDVRMGWSQPVDRPRFSNVTLFPQ